jgi:hypothetical protein
MKPILFFLVLIFTIANFADIGTFLLLGRNGVHDSNPLIVKFGTPIWMYVLKIGVNILPWILLFYYDNPKLSDFSRFCYIQILALGTIALALGAYSNIIALNNPLIIAQAAQATTQEKVSYYSKLMGFLVVFPYIVSIIVFKIWQIAGRKKIDSRSNV